MNYKKSLKDLLAEHTRIKSQELIFKDSNGAAVIRRNSMWLYFIRCQDTVKVGIAKIPNERLKELQTGAPAKLELLAAFPNMGHLETDCHHKLSHLKLYGEWFKYERDVDLLIEELKQCKTP